MMFVEGNTIMDWINVIWLIQKIANECQAYLINTCKLKN